VFDRCFGGSLSSAGRHYLDGLWRQLGVDPLRDEVSVIEAHLVRATLASHKADIDQMRADFNRNNK
jgi:hypothetical protein